MWFVDSSVALHPVIPGGDLRAGEWFRRMFGGEDPLLASVLMRVEVLRVIRREDLPTDTADWLLDRIHFVRVDDRILRYASNIEPHVRTLDALHLATAALSDASPTMVTHDAQMRHVANQLGIRTFDPLAQTSI